MKSSKPTDPFNIKHCLKGLGLFIIHTHSQAYYFCFYLTFKKSLKAMAGEFKDADDNQIDDILFFKDIDDPIVRNAYQLMCILIKYCEDYMLRNGLDDARLLDWDDSMESNRYAPSWFYFGRRTSYVKIKLGYERFLDELANSFYYYCCALSLNSYQIPLHMRTHLDYALEGSFRHLNVENYEVNSMIELIEQLQAHHRLLRGIMK